MALRISPIGMQQPYIPSYGFATGGISGTAASGEMTGAATTNGVANASGANGTSGGVQTDGVQGASLKNPLDKATGKVECEACKNRKYQDGSDENVSFKSPSKISPEAAGSRVRAHEQEHVANAYSKAAEKGGKVIQASVALKTAVCPECGRSYVAGGTTTTMISYPKDSYGQNRKSYDRGALMGANIDQTL